jgi:hypothetical protein
VENRRNALSRDDSKESLVDADASSSSKDVDCAVVRILGVRVEGRDNVS